MIRRLTLVVLVMGALALPGTAQAHPPPCLWDDVPTTHITLIENFRDC